MATGGIEKKAKMTGSLTTNESKKNLSNLVNRRLYVAEFERVVH